MAEYRNGSLRFIINGGVVAETNQAQFTWSVYVIDGGPNSHDIDWEIKLYGNTLVSEATKTQKAQYQGTLVSSSAFHVYKGYSPYYVYGDNEQHGLFEPMAIEIAYNGSSKSFSYDFGDNTYYRAYFDEFSAFNDAQDPAFTYGAYGYADIAEIRLVDVSGNISTKKLPIPTSEELLSYSFVLTAAEKQILYDIISKQDYSSTSIQFELQTEFTDGITLSNSISVIFSVTDSAPTLAPEIVDTNAATIALTGDSSVLVRYWSNAQVTPNAAGSKGNTIVDFGFQNGTEIYQNYETINLEKIEFNVFDFYATDNKNQTIRQTVTTPFIPYVKLNTRITSGAPSGEGEMNLVVKGSFYHGNFGVADNELFVYYRMKLKDDEEYGDWVQFTDVTIDENNHTYEARIYLTGLDYQATYVFQSQAADALDTVLSIEKVIATTPIFDWSDKDFNFNVPVYIQGHLIGGANTMLWSGEDLVMANAAIALAEPISAQMHGIVLVFSSATGDVSWSTHFIPKAMIEYFNGGAQTCMMANNAGLSTFGAKYVYITDESITGHASNDATGTAASGITFDNSAFVLRYVIGV